MRNTRKTRVRERDEREKTNTTRERRRNLPLRCTCNSFRRLCIGWLEFPDNRSNMKMSCKCCCQLWYRYNTFDTLEMRDSVGMPRRFSCFILEMCVKKYERLAIGMCKNASWREREKREKNMTREREKQTLSFMYYSPTSLA